MKSNIKKVFWLCMMCVLVTGLFSCDSSSGDADSSADRPENPAEMSLSEGTVINYVKSTLSSVPAVAFYRNTVGQINASGQGNGLVGEISSRDSNCGTHGEPYEDGNEVSSGSAGYAAGLAYCKIKYNDISPETIQGALTISGGLSCVAYRQGLFDDLSGGGENTITTDITITTTCFGSQAEVNEMVAEMGTATLPDVQLTVTDLSTGDSEYDYRLDVEVDGETMSTYIKYSDTVLAAKTIEGEDSWAFMINTADGVMVYEYLDNTWTRRMRLYFQGTFTSNNTVNSVTTLEGAYLQGGEGDSYALTTFESDGSSVREYGYTGVSGTSFQTQVNGNCEGSDCTDIAGITASQSDAESFLGGLSSAATAQNSADALLNFSEVDVSVSDTYNSL